MLTASVVTVVVTVLTAGSPTIEWDLQVAERATPWEVVDQATRELTEATRDSEIDVSKLRSARFGPRVVAMGVEGGWFWWRYAQSSRLYGTILLRDGPYDLHVVRGEDSRLYLVRGLPGKRKRGQPTWPI
jgi:hypothetical protein